MDWKKKRRSKLIEDCNLAFTKLWYAMDGFRRHEGLYFPKGGEAKLTTALSKLEKLENSLDELLTEKDQS